MKEKFMNNEKIKEDMSIEDVLYVMSEGNPGAINVLVQMLSDKNFQRGMLDFLLLDSLGIRGPKIWGLYNDCCERDFVKYNRTLMAIRCGAFSQKEIDTNLDLPRSVPFLYDSVVLEGVCKEEDFAPTNPSWIKYIDETRKVFVPKLEEAVESWSKH